VLGLAVAGILALLLIYPLRKQAGNLWINAYARFFYLALFPLIVLLGIAIWKRIQSYGITESRYFVLVLGGWLAAMAGYFVFSVRKDIRLIPASLCLLALLSLWGPWSAANVSLAAQRGRLRHLLEKNGLFAADGKVQPAKNTLSLEDRRKISAITDYLMERYGYRVLQGWFHNDLDSLMRRGSIDHQYGFRKSTAILDLMGVAYADKYETSDTVDRYIVCEVGGDMQAIRLDSAGFVLPNFYLNGLRSRDTNGELFLLGNDSVLVRLDADRHRLLLTLPHGAPLLAFDLRPIERRLAGSGKNNTDLKLPPSEMTIRNGSWIAYLTNIAGEQVDTVVHISNIRGHLVLGK
jgi:hypothetical protein